MNVSTCLPNYLRIPENADLLKMVQGDGENLYDPGEERRLCVQRIVLSVAALPDVQRVPA